AHRKPGGTAMLPVRNGAVMRVYVADHFGKEERKLAVGFDRRDVPWTYVVLAGRPRIEAVHLDHDQIVARDKGRNGVAAVASPLVVALAALHRPVVPLRPAVK